MIYTFLLFVLIAIDQMTKYLVDISMFEGESIPLIDNFFHITYVQNRGIAFGMFQGKIDIISIVTVLAIVAIAYHLFKERFRLSLVEKMGYIYILAGAIGNMLDRVLRGFVVDMIDFRGIWGFIFNVADVWINIGVLFIILDQLIIKKKEKSEEDKK